MNFCPLGQKLRFRCVQPHRAIVHWTVAFLLFESLTITIKIADTRMGICYFWQRMRDSNPRERSQSPVCYRYTNPLSGPCLLYAKITKCQGFCKKRFTFLILPRERAFHSARFCGYNGRFPFLLDLSASAEDGPIPGRFWGASAVFRYCR